MKIRIAIYTSLLVFFLSLVGCGMAEYDDISSDVKYAHLIGTQYQSLQKLRLHGVTLDKNYRKQIDLYSVSKYPGFDGPELVSLRQLKPGSIFKIKAVVQCNNCLFSSPIFVMVEILSEDLEAGIPVRLSGMRVEDADGRVTLDPAFFRKLR